MIFSDMTVVNMFKDRQYRCCGECKHIIKYNGSDWRCSRTGKKMKSWDAWHRNYVHCAEYEKLVIGEKPIYLSRHTPYFPVMTAREIEIARESYRYKEKEQGEISMSKMAEVAKLLGVELNEEFEVDDYFYGENDKSTYTYRLTENELQTFVRVFTCGGGASVERWVRNDTMLRDLLRGDDRYKIVRKPWMPKDGETYYTYAGKHFMVSSYTWRGDSWEYGIYKGGVVFRTREEAVAARPRVYKEMTGKEWSENGD